MKSRYYYKNEQSNEKDHDYGGVHTNSSVFNFAFYKVAMALGGYSWERAGQIWYAALTDKQLQREPETPYNQLPKLVNFANLTVEHAKAPLLKWCRRRGRKLKSYSSAYIGSYVANKNASVLNFIVVDSRGQR